MMSLWDALRMNMMISYQELVRTFLSSSKSVVARLGGDEFGVLLPESTYKEAEEFLHKLRAGITSYNLNSQKKYNIDFSAGIIEYDEKIHTECSAIMQDADERMYEIKKGKR
ncbi:diguanylate cyclase [Klebsiella pneumoniae]|uniref:diguanylate cyclase domain-containing protein n=2 Tax=Klebsiella pneumoniae TaxID=573 RepID=UPI000650A89B|nr:diguanylate cyclase [Klebsiella pneumoniae]SXV34839.1 diguanylate cyclase [Klebsiella pneumoniae]SYL43170.1 diguanylate cyclase [Klebsiella pneumoniae]SYL73504.1 diguanylate cyclase [Klebsiella pneumoniae]SYL83963.1 diguanylate cyclase [Klebsiella pneumoniae]SYL84510.1 diguanylate cyclase [Klebsiella pneumoniae]